MKVYLGLGSNLGDREANLRQAVEAIDALPCTAVEAVSRIIETEPEGCFAGRCATPGDDSAGRCATPATGSDGLGAGVMRGKGAGRSSAGTGKSTACTDEALQGRFLNCCVKIRTAMTPHRLLEAVKEIERRLGRENEGIRKNEKGERIYSDRPIDIDILLYGKRHINEPDLQIPHPRMHEREFVMRPLREIATKQAEMSQKTE